MGGAVPALFASDLGGGKFDGAHLVMNFESLNPANTWWRKNYTVFADVDNEPTASSISRNGGPASIS